MTPSAPAASRPPFYASLFAQVLAALVIGIVLGIALPAFSINLKVLSDAFLKLVSMIVGPIVFCVVVHGIAGAGDLKKVGRVGVKALIYFEAMTTVALALGLLLAFVVGPGRGMNIDPTKLDPAALGAYADNAHKLKAGGIGAFLLNIIPSTIFDALARNDVLQVLFFAIIFGVALLLIGEKGEPVTRLIDSVSSVLFRAMGLDRARGALRRARSGRLYRGPIWRRGRWCRWRGLWRCSMSRSRYSSLSCLASSFISPASIFSASSPISARN